MKIASFEFVDTTGWAAPSGLVRMGDGEPRALPWAGMCRPVGAEVDDAWAKVHGSSSSSTRLRAFA